MKEPTGVAGVINRIALEDERARFSDWEPAVVRMNPNTFSWVLAWIPTQPQYEESKLATYPAFGPKRLMGLKVLVDSDMADGEVDVLCLSSERKTTSIQPDPPKPKVEVDGGNPVPARSQPLV